MQSHNLQDLHQKHVENSAYLYLEHQEKHLCIFSLHDSGARGMTNYMCMPWVQDETLGTRSYAGSSAESTKTPSHFAGALQEVWTQKHNLPQVQQ